MLEPIIITVPMFSSPVVQLLIVMIVAIAAFRAVLSILKQLPFL